MKTLIILLTLTIMSFSKTGNEIAQKIITKINDQTTQTTSNGTTRTEILWNNELVPQTINILSNDETPAKVVFLVAAGNFGLEFDTHENKSLAEFYLENDYLVIGITPRSDNLQLWSNPDFTEDWGIEKRVSDVRKIIRKVKKSTDLKYEIIGFSFGAAVALDYSIKYRKDGRLKKTIVYGLDSFDPINEPQKIDNANSVYNAMIQLMNDSGVYVDAGTAELAAFIPYALGNPALEADLVGALVYSGFLDGIHTSITGLPGEWSLESNAAGFVDQTGYGLEHFKLETLAEGAAKFKSGLIPLAMTRDYSSATSFNGEYEMKVHKIKSEVIWINGELGYGNQGYWATQINNASFESIPRYGHIDLLLGRNAEFDIWYKFIQ